MKARQSLFGLTALFIASTLSAAAQQPSPSPMMQGRNMPMMRGMEQSGAMPMMGMMGMADHVEGRIAFLKAELKITDAQLPQWNAYADALRSNAQRMTNMRDMQSQSGQPNTMSAPDRLERMEKMMTTMVEALRTTKTALGPLYAVLNDEQKKVADALLRGPMGMMGSM
jgi:hypothetical protein